MQNDQKTQAPSPMSVTEMGNPGNPAGLAGQDMLLQMNQSNFAVTGWALSFFDYEDTDSVLDIGCGGGVTLQRLSARLPEGHLTGVDHSPVAVAVSRKTNLRDITMGRAEIVEASVAALPFPDSSFDKIITVESFYFWPDPAENLKEVFRVLKPGGTFLLAADIYDTYLLKFIEKSVRLRVHKHERVFRHLNYHITPSSSSIACLVLTIFEDAFERFSSSSIYLFILRMAS